MRSRNYDLHFAKLLITISLGALLLQSGCSLVFDVDSEDVELIDSRRDFASLWRAPEYAGFFDDAYTVPLVPSPFIGERSPQWPADADQAMLPFARGVDGQIYWPMYRFDRRQPSLYVHRMPSGELDASFPVDDLERVAQARYMIFTRPRATTPAQAGKVYFVVLGRAPIEVSVPVENSIMFRAGAGAIVSYDPSAKPRQLQLVRALPSDELESLTLDWPVGAGLERQFGQRSFMYDPRTAALVYYDEMKRLWINPISGWPPADLGRAELLLTSADKVLFADEQKLLHSYSLSQRADVSLGVRVQELGAYHDMRLTDSWLVVCAADGLRSLPLEPLTTPATIHRLDDRFCNSIREVGERRVRYWTGRTPDRHLGPDMLDKEHTLVEHTAPLDGSEPVEDVLDWAPLTQLPLTLARCANGLRAYSLNLKAGGNKIGDGWINNWKFSDEAYNVSFSHDCRRVRWKEHMEDAEIGELYSAEVTGGRRLRLARNAYVYFELYDGRVLTRSNLLGVPTEARLLLIDEQARQAHWLLDGTVPVARAKLIEPLNELLLGVIDEEHGIAGVLSPSIWARLPLPPRS